MTAPSHSDPTTLPAFEASGFTHTQAPNPSWSFGEPITATEAGRKWAEEEKLGWKTIEPAKEDRRKMLAFFHSAIAPRPIAFVSSIAANGQENLAPFSWFNQVCTDPPVISISCATAPRHKDTGTNIRETRGFTVNIISQPWVVQADCCSIDAPPEVNEWALSGLTKEPSISVAPARVKESAVSMECELLQHIEVKHPSGGVAANLILATVKYVHIRNAVLTERGTVDPAKLLPVGRMGDITYAKISNGFRVVRPIWAEVKEECEAKFGDAL
ncbi:hypothetical protein C8F01DRAFT_1258008 [Mycena amicta]|nr:hypothetical protein C8F01DRAFT_1258008 [Mycena amicta]